MTVPLVSVVVPTRNRAALLSRLLRALAAQDYPRYEVVVVDDASTDATREVLAQWKGPLRRVVRLQQPRGSYAARNAGWREAQGEIIAFTDDDCLPSSGWLSALVEGMGPETPGVQGVTLAEPGEITPFTHQIQQTEPGAPYRTCNIAYRRQVLEEQGGFDESYRWYADNILGLRVRRHGDIAFAPGAVVRHPPRPREWRDRAQWLARFDADARHRRELHELGVEPVSAPRSVLPVLLWIGRPLLKQSLAHARYALRRPRSYLAGMGPMLREKRELLAAMRTFYQQGSSTPERPLALPPLSTSPLVSVVVVTRDRPALLAQTLEALAKQTWDVREVIVVDNGGGLEDPDGARLVPAVGMSLGAARQAGVEAARGAIIAFTDDDCLPDPAWIEEMVAAFQRDRWLLGVQGRTLAQDGPLDAHAVRIERLNPLFQTCNIAYRREAIERAGGFDPDFTGWFEDTDLGARIQGSGPIAFTGSAVVVHQAVPRRTLSRDAWRRLIADECRLAARQPDFYRRVRGPSPAFTVAGRWLIGSPLKRIARAIPRAISEPRGFLALALGLLRERWELAAALLERRG
jgi:glycosyltransferase involved in cell wall biosynthesis